MQTKSHKEAWKHFSLKWNANWFEVLLLIVNFLKIVCFF